MLNPLNQLLQPIRRQINAIVARAVVTVITDTKKLQQLQLAVLEGETRDLCERFQEYGFTSVPLAGAEAVVLFVGGRRDHPLVIAVDDRAYRKTGLQPGECALYNHQGAYVLVKTGPGVEVNAPVNLVNGAVYQIAGNQVVGPRGSSVTAPIGGTTVDAQARTAINDLISRLQAHGLIA